MKKLIYVVKDFPYPTSNGYRVRVYNQVNRLSKLYDLTLIIVTIGNREVPSDKDLKDSLPFVKHLHLIKLSKTLLIMNLIRSMLKWTSIEKNILKSKRVKNILKYTPHDILYLSTIRLAYLVNEGNSQKTILDLIDLISENYRRSAINTRHFLKKLYFLYEKNKLSKYEYNVIENFDAIFLINPLEVNKLSKGSTKSIQTLSNGVEAVECSFSKNSRIISMLGPLDYHPNMDALKWFIDEVGDFLIEQKIIIHYIGKKSPKAPLHPNIEYLGYIEKPYEVICKSECFVAPMINGAGVQNKILEAMSCGKIVLTTSIAAEPILGTRNNKNIIICNTPSDFKQALMEIINKGLHKDLGINAKTLMKQNYNWDKIITDKKLEF